ncbi:elongation of very long chain fatty acids protein 5 [Striga asiatica]|uniref:very-long-chain 3-oxoacyl-CoA synthase n=1 Tax=Striga asiatica TaxID=4170 RepID=A0A5A7PMV8_STRAF|nr:elongation of very long chain fatty acids protein 5 [Striga asiatica]
MTILYDAVHYYLVDHPVISQYEWRPGQSPGATPLFLSTTVCTYLTLTLLLRQFPILPALPTAALRAAAAAHNTVLCLLSLVMAAGAALSALHQTPPDNPAWPLCFPLNIPSKTAGPTFFWAHVFYFSKILEFADTLLILLRGARRRLSFLHVYHHAAVVGMCYAWLSAPQSLFPVGIVTNSAVHVVMYGYYLLAALGFRPPWKKAVTNCQIAQFLFGYVISGVTLYLHVKGPGCAGMWSWVLNMMFVTSLLVLFLNFHRKNYGGRRLGSAVEKNKRI